MPRLLLRFWGYFQSAQRVIIVNFPGFLQALQFVLRGFLFL